MPFLKSPPTTARWLTFVLLGISGAQGRCQAPQARASQDAIASSTRRFVPVTRALVDTINRGDQSAMQRLFSPNLRKILPAEKTAQIFVGVVAPRGKIGRIGAPRLDDGTAYTRLGAERGVWDLELKLNAQNQISSLFIRGAGPFFTVAARGAKPLALPFRGEWTVLWGGEAKKQNYHVDSPAQRRAIDWEITDNKGQPFRNFGRSNADFYAYGKPILAAGAGKVVQVIDGVAENLPGQMNAVQVLGNCVVVQQAPHEFAFYAHLQPGSIRVKVGVKVAAGQGLGKCGNSGNSSRPHLHFHLQNTPELGDGSGIAPYFRAVRVSRSGHTVLSRNYTPLRGDHVSASGH